LHNRYLICIKQHQIRSTFVTALKAAFPDYGLTYSIGGQISFDVFPNGWDKTYALRHVQDEKFEEIHFFGDKTDKVICICYFNTRALNANLKGGNDYELFIDDRTIGHTVSSPEDTLRQVTELFLS
jgi:phosphomannomutase